MTSIYTLLYYKGQACWPAPYALVNFLGQLFGLQASLRGFDDGLVGSNLLLQVTGISGGLLSELLGFLLSLLGILLSLVGLLYGVVVLLNLLLLLLSSLLSLLLGLLLLLDSLLLLFGKLLGTLLGFNRYLVGNRNYVLSLGVAHRAPTHRGHEGHHS